MEKPQYKKFAIAAVIVALFTVPIFSSGGRTHLTFFQFMKNHTIFGPPVEYVPEEDYACELEGVKITTEIKRIPSSSSIQEAMRFYQISEESASELLSH